METVYDWITVALFGALVVLFLHWLGALVYFVVGHPKRKTPPGS